MLDVHNAQWGSDDHPNRKSRPARMKLATNKIPDSATTPFCFTLSSLERRRRERVSGAQIRSATPIMIIGMKSSISSLHAPGKANVPAGAKSRVAMAANPINSLLSELTRSFISICFDKTKVAI